MSEGSEKRNRNHTPGGRRKGRQVSASGMKRRSVRLRSMDGLGGKVSGACWRIEYRNRGEVLLPDSQADGLGISSEMKQEI